ncbi:MAG: hypothetical protein IIZ09_00785 [Ruminococcus sp.]|nr:hypothetical protein [Ruminococcus sp.]
MMNSANIAAALMLCAAALIWGIIANFLCDGMWIGRKQALTVGIANVIMGMAVLYLG